jgi:hypothetical protein
MNKKIQYFMLGFCWGMLFSMIVILIHDLLIKYLL